MSAKFLSLMFRRNLGLSLMLMVCMTFAGCQNLTPLPDGISYKGAAVPASSVAFYADQTWVDTTGKRHVRQEIFDEVLAIIRQSRQLVVMDMFLYNDFQGVEPELTRALSTEITDALIAQKQRYPAIDIVVITDPVNTLYGGLPSAQFERMKAQGIRVVTTNLDALHDSNFVYSTIWRVFFRPFGNSPGRILPNPIGEGRVSIRTYLKLLNFKANHRKTLVADSGDDYVALITSANAHDGSSAHRNIAVRFNGQAIQDLFTTEKAVVDFSSDEPIDHSITVQPTIAQTTVQVVTEGEIKRSLIDTLARSKAGESLDFMIFYLSDRDVIKAMIESHERGVRLRVLLDPNKDAFGRKKGGIPNRPVARELVRAGIPVRWCDTHGEQCHSKMLLHISGNDIATLNMGSANYTRRNLSDLNLETNVVVVGPASETVFRSAQQRFDDAWTNEGGRVFSVDYEAYADSSLFQRLLYRFMEATGIGTF